MHDITLICVCVLVTMLTRFLPFLIFRKKTPRIVTYLGTVLPCAIMGMLVVYCMKDVTFLSGSYGIPEILCAGSLNPIEQTGYLNVLLGAFLRLAEYSAEESVETDLSSKMILYINEHYKENITLSSIAHALGYNKHHLSRCFRASFHVTLNEYINTLRLRNAVTMIRENNKDITACALESGFGSLRTFYRTFTGEYGCSPKEYLKQTSMS